MTRHCSSLSAHNAASLPPTFHMHMHCSFLFALHLVFHASWMLWPCVKPGCHESTSATHLAASLLGGSGCMVGGEVQGALRVSQSLRMQYPLIHKTWPAHKRPLHLRSEQHQIDMSAGARVWCIGVISVPPQRGPSPRWASSAWLMLPVHVGHKNPISLLTPLVSAASPCRTVRILTPPAPQLTSPTGVRRIQGRFTTNTASEAFQRQLLAP